jgi:hypothetical protein
VARAGAAPLRTMLIILNADDFGASDETVRATI